MKISFFLALACLPLFINAQELKLPLQHYAINHWSTLDGLTTNNLRDLVQDDRGYLWIASFNGLLRFDGVRFVAFNADNEEQFVSSSFNFIQKDDQGFLWCGTQSGGLIRIDNGQFSNITYNLPITTTIRSSYKDSNQILWIGTQGNGLYQMKDSVLTSVANEITKNSTITSITEFKNQIWYATEGQGLFKMDGDSLINFNEREGFSSNVINILRTKDNTLFAGTTHGLLKFTTTWEIVSGTDDLEINDLAFDDTSIWIAAESGMGRVDLTGGFDFIDDRNGLTSRQISGIYVDQEKDIWLTTKKGGLVSLKESNFINYTMKNGLSSNQVNIVSKGPKGTLYIGEDNGSIDEMKGADIWRMKLNTPLDNMSIKDILLDKKGNLWIASYKGVIKKSGNKESLFSTENGFPSNQPRCLFQDAEGHVWVGSRNGGLVRFNEDDSFKIYNTDDGFLGEYVFCIDQAPDGRILAGTYDGYLNTIYPNGKVESSRVGKENEVPLIFNITFGKNDQLWLATNIGLFAKTTDGFRLLGKEQGLPVETIFDIVEDSSDHLWMSSNLGLVQVSHNELVESLNQEKPVISAVLYNEMDGMVTRECTGATRMLKDSNNKIWIPTLDGLSYLDPNKIIKNTIPPKVIIESLEADGEKISLDHNPISLSHGHRKYTLHYTALSYRAPDKVRFKYRLEPFDPEWVENVSERQVTYTNLPFGEYKFVVDGTNNDGVWAVQPASLDFKIRPYFYETNWFIGLVILVFLGFTFLIYWLRLRVVVEKNRELQKLNEELDGFVYSVSHDLRAPLSSVLGLVNIARLDPDDKSLNNYLDKMESSVRKLDDFIKEIINYSRNVRLEIEKESCNIKQLVVEIAESLTYMNPNERIKLKVECSDDLEVKIDKRRMSMIISNLLSNAYRYSKDYISNPIVRIIVQYKSNHLILRVIDNGIGIQQDRIPKIFDMFYRAHETGQGSGLGLYIVKESVAKMSGKVDVNSELEKGTEFIVDLPVS